MSELQELLLRRLDGSVAAISSLRVRIHDLMQIAIALRGTLASGGTIYTCGNGGSAAEALHLAEELIGRYRGDRAPFRAMCLNADPTALTCIANDFGFDEVFARQCAALLTPRDALVAFSTSGNSANIVRALQAAREAKARTIGLLGRDGGRSGTLCDLRLVVAADDTAHIQEAHQAVLHLLCESLEQPARQDG
jgi:D-sedoheptulose 7-phosphate isomerase